VRAGVICRYAMSAAAVVAAMALVVSTVPASAQAATSRSNETSTTRHQLLPAQAFHPEPGQSVRIASNGAVLPDTSSSDAIICLYHEPDSCVGSNPNDNGIVDVLSQIIDVVQAALPYIEIWIKNGNGSDENQGEEGGTDPGEGLCLAAKGLDQQLTELPCNSTHGIYWQYHQVVPGYKVYQIWNTEYHCFMTAHATTQGTWVQCSKLSQEPWSTWGYYPS
jgi:hypothetical protein